LLDLNLQLFHQGRDIGDQAIEDSLDDVLERSFDNACHPVLDEVGDEVDHGLQDPVQGAESVHVHGHVADVGDLESCQLKSFFL